MAFSNISSSSTSAVGENSQIKDDRAMAISRLNAEMIMSDLQTHPIFSCSRSDGTNDSSDEEALASQSSTIEELEAQVFTWRFHCAYIQNVRG